MHFVMQCLGELLRPSEQVRDLFLFAYEHHDVVIHLQSVQRELVLKVLE